MHSENFHCSRARIQTNIRNDNSILEEYKVTDSEYPDYTDSV